MAKKTSAFDIVVIGAGPAGLSFARAVADTGLSVCLVERQSRAELANPPLDGRDIALTHDSVGLMQDLGMMDFIPKKEIAPLRSAKVFSGASSYFLGFDTTGTGKDALGFLVPNNAIRKAAYRAASQCRNVILRDKVDVKKVETDEQGGRVTLAHGEVLSAALVIAADSRFSAARRQMGIAASMTDFGRSAIVCRVSHDLPHGEVAQECFFDQWTLAILPLQGNTSSIVITLPNDEVDAVMAMPDKAFNQRIGAFLGDKIGAVRLKGEKHAYPLVAVYAGEFAARRFALVGDAAIGMHPVTAHGYNLGLAGACRLANEIRMALSRGLEIGDVSVLDAYAKAHRRASAFLYHGTNAMVNVYTDNRPATLLLRGLGLRVANHLPPFKRFVTRQLTGKAE